MQWIGRQDKQLESLDKRLATGIAGAISAMIFVK